MKSLFLRVVLAFGGILVLLAIIGSFLPRDFSVSAEIEINAPAESVFAQINDLKNWRYWSSWNADDVPDLKVEFGPTTVGEGASQVWTDARGTGKLWITESTPNSEVNYDMEFRGFPRMENQFKLVESGDKTSVSWSSEGRLPPGPFYGWFGFLFESGLASEYGKALEKLKHVTEKSKRPSE